MTRDECIYLLERLTKNRRLAIDIYKKKRWRASEIAMAVSETKREVEALETAVQSLKEGA